MFFADDYHNDEDRLSLLLIICITLAAGALIAEDPMQKSPLGAHECSDKLFADMVTPLGYPFASMTSTTDNSYILKMFRILAKNTKSRAGLLVFLQHGMVDSADYWVIDGEKNSLNLVLANAGYDV